MLFDQIRHLPVCVDIGKYFDNLRFCYLFPHDIITYKRMFSVTIKDLKIKEFYLNLIIAEVAA